MPICLKGLEHQPGWRHGTEADGLFLPVAKTLCSFIIHPGHSQERQHCFYTGKWMTGLSSKSGSSSHLTLQVNNTPLCVCGGMWWGVMKEPQTRITHSTSEGLAWDLMPGPLMPGNVHRCFWLLFILHILAKSSPSLLATIYGALRNKHFTHISLFKPPKMFVKILLSPSFCSEEFGAQSGQTIYLRSSCWSAAELRLEPRSHCPSRTPRPS